jgi:hypothetical protein
MTASVHDRWADVIDSALTQLVDVAGLDVAFGARVQPDGQRLVISRLRGARTDGLRDLVVLKGTGLGGKAMALGRPVSVTDYARAGGISHQYDPTDQVQTRRRPRAAGKGPALMPEPPRQASQ